MIVSLVWRICLFSLLCLPFAHAKERPVGELRHFWVRNLLLFPSKYREAETMLVGRGARTNLYVENGLALPSGFSERLLKTLETKAPAGALYPDLGVVPILEKVFGPLPNSLREDDKLNVVFANFRSPLQAVDGFFHPYDQLSAAEAEAEGHRSNEANVVYVNGFRASEESTTSVVARATEELLTHGATGDARFTQDLWLAQTLGQSALLATGLHTDQGQVKRFAGNSSWYPLVSHTSVQQGPQILFASYLLDQVGEKGEALSSLSRLALKGRSAVEALFRTETGTPLTFDLIYANFLTYLFNASGSGRDLPLGMHQEGTRGLRLPEFEPYLKLKLIPAIAEGQISPYSFAIIELPDALPATAIVEVELMRQGLRRIDGSLPCSETASVLWKPVTAKRIAVYSVGCEHTSELDRVHFRLSVLDKPFQRR